MELIDALNGTGIIDPRPWLLLLLQDESRDVRLHTISILGSMDDPAIARRLQSHLADERDPTVAARIRRVLDLR
jgi:HEAT repeat protein